MNRGLTWQRVGKTIMGWLSPPWKPTATALTLIVVWYLRTVLEALANELRNALLNPLSESDTWLRSFAVAAHRAVFVEMFVLCEILIIGAIVVALTNFIFAICNRIRKGLGRLRNHDPKARTARPTRRGRAKQLEPIRLPQSHEHAPDDDAA